MGDTLSYKGDVTVFLFTFSKFVFLCMRSLLNSLLTNSCSWTGHFLLSASWFNSLRTINYWFASSNEYPFICTFTSSSGMVESKNVDAAILCQNCWL